MGLRNFLGLLLAGGMLTPLAAARTNASLVLLSQSVLVLDQDTGERLVEKRAEDVLPIASITKLMTAMVVLDAQLDPDELITITAEDMDMLRHSRSRLPVETQISRGEALHLALMSSENRAAHALGRTFPGGLEAFVPAMNAKAAELELLDTYFLDPAGLDAGNVSSAQDLAKLVGAAYQYPQIRDFTTSDAASIQSGRRSIPFHNTNRLLWNPQWQIGLSKTGFINEAGRCLVMQAKVAQRSMVIVLLDGDGALSRFQDANRIKQWMEGTSLTPVVHRKTSQRKASQGKSAQVIRVSHRKSTRRARKPSRV